jgi:putative ABC transport system permease protein
MKFAPYLLKTLWRHRTRTLLTVLGSAVALFVFTFIGAMQQGLGDLTANAQAESRLIVFQANRFCPATSRLPEDYALAIGKMDGVQEAVPIQVYTNNCRASLDVVVFNGMPADKLRRVRDFQLLSGSWEDFTGRRDAALVGQALAQRRGLAPGQRFSIGPVTVYVAGIYTAANAAEESFLYTNLEFLQRTRGLSAVGLVTQFEVILQPGADAQAVCRAIDQHYRSGPVTTDTRPKGAFQTRALGDLAELIHFAGYLAYACVGLVFALVATTTVMAVQDRIREHAVLQTLGYTWRRIFGFVLTETLVVSMAGGLAGVGAAVLTLSWTGLAIGAEAVTIAFAPSWALVFSGLLASAGVGLFAGLAPAWQASRADIVRSLRQV